ncbi:MAG: hypothetical protein ACOY37_05485 [Pseudomonadota bacterium]
MHGVADLIRQVGAVSVEVVDVDDGVGDLSGEVADANDDLHDVAVEVIDVMDGTIPGDCGAMVGTNGLRRIRPVAHHGVPGAKDVPNGAGRQRARGAVFAERRRCAHVRGEGARRLDG